MKTLLALLTALALGGCATSGGYRDHQAEIDATPEVPPAGDVTNGANGPSHAGSL